MKTNKKETGEINELSPIGKIAIIIFFVLLIFFSIYNRVTEKNKKAEEKIVYKTNREILSLINKIDEADNYKEDIFITTDYTRKEIIINKDHENASILIKDNNSVSKYYKVNDNYYTIDNNNAVKLEDTADITKDFISIMYPKTYSKFSLVNSKDYLEEKYKIKRLNINLNTKNEKIKADINYNDNIVSIKADVTPYYNYINNTNENKVTYEIEFSDIENITIDEIKIYDLQ